MTELSDSLRLGVEQVTARLDPAELPFKTTDEIHALDAVFGQERATRSIEFALGMTQPGYNLYASGPDGIGKASIVEGFLRRRATQMPTPRDWVYVHNFNDPDRPIGISLPAGSGRQFAEQVHRAVESAGEKLRTTFESDSYARQRNELATAIEQERATILETLQGEATHLGFTLQMTPQGISYTPSIDDQTLTPAQRDRQPHALQERGTHLDQRIQDALLEMRAVERTAREHFEQLDSEVAAFAIGHLFEPLLEAHGDDLEVAEFLNAARSDLERERDKFRTDMQQQPLSPGLPAPATPTRRYQVNPAICHESNDGAPVIFEQHPTYNNLLGRIEYQGQFGTITTDHTLIKPGSLAMANGGFIVLRLRDLLMNPPSLDGLKRALSTTQITVEAHGLTTTSGLRPESIPLDVKVVIIGDPGLYSQLYRLDPDFRELFRVKADFETDFKRNDENTLGLAAYIRSQCDRGGMRCLEAGAVARLVEHSSRMVEDQKRLSANLSTLLDLVRQADYWAGLDGAEAVTTKHVDRALDEAIYRSALVRDRIQEMIQEGTVRVETDDTVVGQINALSVYDLGDISFGRPSRITCVVSPGRGQIVMVERESDMAGRIHNKGFLILRGFLTGRFGQHVASTLHASLTFEQLYGDIDGDSASSTELYVLLSALADVPIRQGIAVTGSVDQHGRIQPIGGATHKIEGFHAVCKERGLDGTHGVMIPRANISSIVLRPEVAQDIADGLFHIWAADTIEEGIEVLTGIPAGERDDDGIYPEGSVFRKVRDRLTEFAAELHAGPEGTAPAPEPRLYAPQLPTPTPPGIPPQPPPDPPVIV